jgi:integrase/recombinase XerD
MPTKNLKGQVKMNFNEKQFRQLVGETKKTIIALGTTSETVMQRHRRFTEQLVEHLKTLDVPYERDLCLQWVDSMEHDPAAVLSSSYVNWIAFRRFVILLAEQEARTLNSWKHYLCQQPEMPKGEEFLEIIAKYREYLIGAGYYQQTVSHYTSSSRRLLIYLENQGAIKISDIKHADIAGYFLSPRFKNRHPKGVQTEACELKNFVVFLERNGYTSQEALHYAIPRHRVRVERIITILTPDMVTDIMEDEPDSLVDRRDKAVCLLALHIGLRSCDIRDLKFGDIDWEKCILTIRQQKTDVLLQMPLDNETQNAIIDYVLNERRNCKQEYIFITAVGPAQKIARKHFRIKYRASHEKIPHEGLHIFRRTFASKLLQCGTPLPMISEMLGHIGKDSVQCYLSTDDVRMKRCALDLALIPYRREDF